MTRNARPRLEALTLDVWYTLLYQTHGERTRYERARAAAWTDPLIAMGLPRHAATRWLAALIAQAQRRERSGVAWTLAEQLEWMRARTGVRLPWRTVSRRLARAVREAEARPTPGAWTALERLRDSGHALALVSNVLYEDPASIRALLQRFDLPRRVDAIVLSSELGASKPSPAPIRAALERIHVRPEHAMHVGDQPVDVRAAWAAEVGALRYTGVRRYWPATHVLEFPARWRRAPELTRWRDLASAPEQWATASRSALPRSPRRRTPGSRHAVGTR